MLAGGQRNPPPLVSQIGLDGDHAGVIELERLSFERMLEAPVDHVAQRITLPNCCWNLG